MCRPLVYPQWPSCALWCRDDCHEHWCGRVTTLSPVVAMNTHRAVVAEMTVMYTNVAVVTTRSAVVTTRSAMVTTRSAVATTHSAVVTTHSTVVATRSTVVTTRSTVVTARSTVMTTSGGVLTQRRRCPRRGNNVATIVKIRLTKQSFGHKIFVWFSPDSKFNPKRRFDKLCIFI